MTGVAGMPGRCGTERGYNDHKRRGDEVCDLCRVAHNTYIADWRRRNGVSFRVQAAKQQTRNRALRRLARMYPVSFDALYREEVAAAAAVGERESVAS